MGTATLIRRTPSRGAPALDFDRLFSELWRGLGTGAALGATPLQGALPNARSAPRFAPRVEAVELQDHYRVTAEIPGVEAKDLDITIQDGVLTLRGARRTSVSADAETTSAGDSTEETQAAASSASESPAAAAAASDRFERQLRFPADIVEDQVKAVYRNGVLTLTIPKPPVVEPEVRNVQIETP